MRATVSALAAFAAIAGGSAAAQQEALLADGAFEMITWESDQPDEKFRELCTIVAGSVRCAMQKQMGNHVFSSSISGTLRGNQIVSRAHVRVAFSGDCSFKSDVDLSGTIVLSPDGTLANEWSSGPVTYSSFVGACAGLPTSTPPAPPSQWAGTWRQLSAAEASALALPQPAAPRTVVVVAPDGKAVTINLDDWKGGPLTVQQLELAKQFELKPPSGGTSYTLQTYRYPFVQGKEPPVFAPMHVLDAWKTVQDQVISTTASAALPEFNAGSSALSCAQSAASWAKANPGKASLMALTLAVSIAMPYTAAFQASAGGMTFLESVGIGFMTSATPAAVQSLVTSAASGEGFWTSTGKAAKSGGIAGAESFFSTAVGAGTTGAIEAGAALTRRLVGARVSEQAVKGFGAVTSGIAGSTTDYGVGILHDKAADAIAASASKAPIPDLVPPAHSTSSGGIIVQFLSP